MDDPEERQVTEFVALSNIERFERLLMGTSDERLRQTLSELLASENARLAKIRPSRREDANVDRSEHS